MVARIALAAVCLLCLPSAFGEVLDLTAEERAWIAANPVVRISSDPTWKPLEYVEDGELRGLASEYLAEISRRTGLKFEIVPNSNWEAVPDLLARREIDLIPAAPRGLGQRVGSRIELTSSYYVGNTVIVTRGRAYSTYDLKRFDGQVVALKENSPYEAGVRTLYPQIQLLETRSTQEALLAVEQGRAQAAIGMSVALMPYLQRAFEGLALSGVATNLPVDMTMGVRSDLPILLGIINKALASLTAEETDAMEARWLELADYGAPSWPVLMQYYRVEIGFGLVSLVLIVGFAVHARRQHRLAVRSEKEKTLFLAVVSHEIRSPMNAILAGMELLMQRPDLGAESRRLLGVAAGGAENLLRLLDDVLDISKLEAGRLQLELDPVDITELVRTTTDLQAFRAREKGLVLATRVDTEISERLALDRLRLGQVLHNLVSNAIKFTLAGSVTVSVRLDPHPTLPNRRTLQIQVRDTGVGMDEAGRARLFQPYSQASAATARRFGGTGLGLLICRQLVELMDGDIALESTPDVGTTVTVCLPCDVYQAPAPSAERVALNAAPPAPGTPHGVTVLLVEDTPANQQVLTAQLDALHCRSTLAVSGEAALDELERARFDIVLLDCDLPGISGYEVARRWRETEATRGLAPVSMVAISASTDMNHTSSCFDAGMDGVLKKPIKLGKLRDALQLWAGAHLPEVETEQVVVENEAVLMPSLWRDAQALREAVQGHDREAAVHYAHRLVGAGAVLKLDEIADLARALETTLMQGMDPSAESQVNQLHELLRQAELKNSP